MLQLVRTILARVLGRSATTTFVARGIEKFPLQTRSTDFQGESMRKATVSLFATIALFALTSYAQDDFHRYILNVGGGITFPTGSTSNISGTNGAFQVGGGINTRYHVGLFGEFMWNGFSIKDSALRAIGAPGGNSNLYSITANFIAPFHGPGHFGVYGIIGGGWYHRTWAITAPSVGVG